MQEVQEQDCSFVQDGLFTICNSLQEADVVKKECQELQERGYNVEFIDDGTTIHEMEPGIRSCVSAAMYLPEGAHCDPLLTAIALSEVAQQNGATVIEHTEVIDISLRNPRRCTSGNEPQAAPNIGKKYNNLQQECRAPHSQLTIGEPLQSECTLDLNEQYYAVTCADGSILTAQTVIVATGTWPGFLEKSLGIQVPVVPVKGQMWLTEPVRESLLKHVVYVAEPHIFWDNHSVRDDTASLPIPEHCSHDRHGHQLVRHAYGRKRADGRVVFGGGRIRTDTRDYVVDDEMIASLREHAREFLVDEIMDTALAGM